MKSTNLPIYPYEVVYDLDEGSLVETKGLNDVDLTFNELGMLAVEIVIIFSSEDLLEEDYEAMLSKLLSRASILEKLALHSSSDCRVLHSFLEVKAGSVKVIVSVVFATALTFTTSYSTIRENIPLIAKDIAYISERIIDYKKDFNTEQDLEDFDPEYEPELDPNIEPEKKRRKIDPNGPEM